MSVDDSHEDGVLVSQFHLKVDEGQLVGAHLERVIGPQHSRDSDTE
jgi:hypothetical protein